MMRLQSTNLRIGLQTLLVGGFATAFTLSGCGGAADYELVERHASGSSDMAVARLDVSGMMCAHACGGKIKKELLKVAGVANASIEFEENRPLNFAEVEFDERLVELDGLVEAVSGIADGKLYAVEAVQVTHFAKGSQFN